MDEPAPFFIVEQLNPPFHGDWSAKYAEPKPTRVISKRQPYTWAEYFAEDVFQHRDRPAIARFRGEWWVWRGRSWQVVSDEFVEAQAWLWCASVRIIEKSGLDEAMSPVRRDVQELVAATRARNQIDDRTDMPALLGQLDVDPDRALSCANGILDLRNHQLLPSSPLLFATAGTDVEYLPFAETPVRWLKFLDDIWADDWQSKALLQEFIGLCLTHDTTFQKILLVVGPKRSGKGTVTRVIEKLVGKTSFYAGSFASLEGNFGLQPVIGKTVCCFPDVRIGGKSNPAMIIEKLLSISGEDPQTVDRKNIAAWTGRLRCRVIVQSNEYPDLRDQSGALAGRFLTLKMTRSFYGEEDLDLGKDLLAEAPGILRWALAGLTRLYARGHFVHPRSSADLIKEMGRLNSPVQAFIEDSVVKDPSSSIPCDLLYRRWQDWCLEHGLKATSDNVFGRDLRSVIPDVRNDKRMVVGIRSRHYIGLQLKT